MRHVGKRQQNGILSLNGFMDLLVELGDAIAQLLGLQLACLSFLEFFLPHQGADFLGRRLSLGLQLLHLGEQCTSLCIQLQQLIHLGILTTVA